VRCLCVTIADAATKGAITAFSKSLAIDEASSGVRVNVISPGNIWTPLWKSWSDGGATRLLHLRFLLLTILCPSTLEPPSRLTHPRALFLTCTHHRLNQHPPYHHIVHARMQKRTQKRRGSRATQCSHLTVVARARSQKRASW